MGESAIGVMPNGNGTSAMPSVVPMPLLPQTGDVFVGPGAKKEAQMIGLGLSKLSSRRKDDLAIAKRFAMDLSIKQIMLRQQKSHQENQQKQQMYAQALSLMSRVYIGSISFEVREDMLKRAFEVFGPIKSINMSWDAVTGHHKGFAFLEYDVPEAALLAQESMNGQLMGGRNLKVNSMMQDMRLQVGRPSNMPQAQPIIEMVQQDARKYHRVYVASVHPDLSESDLKSVFEAFGTVIKCQLARQTSGRGMHRGFGYIEFNNANSMNEAIAGMNMFDLGGQYLRVGRCITPPEALTYLQPTTAAPIQAAAAVAAAAITAKVMAAEASAPVKKTSRNSSPAPAAIKQEASPSPAPEPMAIEYTQSPPQQAPDTPPARGFGGPGFVQSPGLVQPTIAPSGYGQHQQPGLVQPPGLMQPGVGIVQPPGLVQPAKPTFPTTTTMMMALPAADSNGEPLKLTSAQRKKIKKEAKSKQTFSDKMAKVLDRQKAIHDHEIAQPVSFGEMDPTIAPKDPLDDDDDDGDQKMEMPAIMGPGRGGDNIQSMALALMDGGGALMAINKQKKEEKELALAGKKPKESKYKRRKMNVDPKKIQPKLNTAQAIAAANKAGIMSDALKSDVMNSEDATLASQEGLEIRGNDARHLLMAKLMRTNRSCILVLRNMVKPEDIDEFLEEEIKIECSKYGGVVEVVIVNDPAAGVVKIFVKFNDPTQVDAAKAALDGRFFGGNTVKADVYDQILYDHGDYNS